MNCKAGTPVSDDLGPLFVQARRFLPSDPAPFAATIALARDSVHAPAAAGDDMIRFLESWLEPEGGRSLFDWQERRDCGL